MDKGFSLAGDLPSLAAGLIVLCRDIELLQKFRDQGVQGVADLGARPNALGRSLRAFAAEHGITAVATADSDMGKEDDGQLFCLLQAVRAKQHHQPGDAAKDHGCHQLAGG